MQTEYERLKPRDPSFDRVEALKAAGVEVCDARDHNAPGGCSRPACFANFANITEDGEEREYVNDCADVYRGEQGFMDDGPHD